MLSEHLRGKRTHQRTKNGLEGIIKIPLGRLRSRWKDNFKTNSRENGCKSVDRIHLTHDIVR